MLPNENQDIPKEATTAKPYTVPKNWKPPTLKELYLYAYRRHPYYQYGYALVALTGLLAFGLSRRKAKRQE